jgi:hypothetical protein
VFVRKNEGFSQTVLLKTKLEDFLHSEILPISQAVLLNQKNGPMGKPNPKFLALSHALLRGRIKNAGG